MGENSKISSDEVDVNIKLYPIRKRTFSAVEDDSSTQVIFYLLFLLDCFFVNSTSYLLFKNIYFYGSIMCIFQVLR